MFAILGEALWQRIELFGLKKGSTEGYNVQFVERGNYFGISVVFALRLEYISLDGWQESRVVFIVLSTLSQIKIRREAVKENIEAELRRTSRKYVYGE